MLRRLVKFGPEGFAGAGARSITIKAMSVCLNLTLAVILARALGAQGYGQYAYVFAWVSLLSIPAQFGLPTLIVRDTARSMANGSWSGTIGLWRWSLMVAMALSLSLAAFGTIIYLVMDTTKDALATVLYGAILLPFLAITATKAASLRGLGYVQLGQLPEAVSRPSVFLLIVLVMILGQATVSASTTMAAHAVAGAIICWATFKQAETREKNHAPLGLAPSYSVRYWIKSSVPLGLMTGLYFVNQQADILILGVFRDEEDIGVYRVASQGAIFVLFAQQAIAMIVAPQFARLHELRNTLALERLIQFAARTSTIFGVLAFLTIVFFGRPLLSMAFSSEFEAGYWALLILSFGNIFNAIFGSVGHLMNMTGHESVAARAAGATAIMNVLLGLLLAPHYGMVGVAAATSISIFILNIALWRYAYTKLGIRTSAMGF